MIQLYAQLLVLLPLAGFAINGLGFRKLPTGLAGFVGIAACLAAFACSLGIYSEFVAGGEAPIVVRFFDWIAIPGLNVGFEFLIDQLTLVMLLMVTGIGSLIHIYSAAYMHHDEGFGKFFAYLNLFIFSMLLLVLGGNYLILFIGWEGVGLCSYLLIGFWNNNPAYNDAARKAFIMNRIGDLGLLVGMFLLIINFGTLSYQEIWPQVATRFAENDPTLIAITVCLFIGAMGKSAQIPLFTWLPDAMAGPTPVSALIHAATMVTAGIYMVIRSNALYSLAPVTQEFIAYIGAATALLGALIGLAQNDIKKVLAYSTVSQLGYMFMALGVGAYSSSLFHVVTHAFFKALLFLGAGSVIHAMSNEQDIRFMGGLSKKLRVTFITFLIGTIAIAGIPPFSGFFSKDEILFQLFLHNKVAWAIGLTGSFLTAFYMFRLLFLTFFGEFRGTEHQREHLHESPAAMTVPLAILAVLATLGGLLNVPEVLGGHAELHHWLSPLLVQYGTPEAHADHASLENTLMAVSVLVAAAGIGLAYVFYMAQKQRPAAETVTLSPIHKLVYRKFYIDELYDRAIVRPLALLSRVFGFVVEYLVIDLAVTGIGALSRVTGKTLRYVQSGSTGLYLLLMVASIALYLTYLFKDILL